MKQPLTIPDNSLSLHAKTLKLFEHRARCLTYAELERISRTQAIGHIPLQWFHKFGNNKLMTPDVNRVQWLYELLSGNPLI